MQAIIESPPAPTAISQVEARQVAQQYVAAQIDPRFAVTNGEHYNSPALGRACWRFIICQEQDPLSALMVDAQTGQIVALTPAEIQVVREKAAIYTARKQGVLPMNEQGYVLGEYARREASSYLDDNLSLFYGAVDPVFIQNALPIWQVTIVFKMYDQGPFILGVMDVNAKTGEPLPLSPNQIKRIRERTRAIIRSSSSSSTSC